MLRYPTDPLGDLFVEFCWERAFLAGGEILCKMVRVERSDYRRMTVRVREGVTEDQLRRFHPVQQLIEVSIVPDILS